MEQMKNLIACIFATVVAYFAPVQSVFLGVAWVFVVNFIFGLLNGMIAKNEEFSFKKAFMCIVEAAVLYVLMASIYFVGERLGNTTGAMQCITAVVYALIYFYTVNVIKNIRGIFPNNKLLKFLYFLLSVEFVKKIPIVGNYIDSFNNKERRESVEREEAQNDNE